MRNGFISSTARQEWSAINQYSKCESARTKHSRMARRLIGSTALAHSEPADHGCVMVLRAAAPASGIRRASSERGDFGRPAVPGSRPHSSLLTAIALLGSCLLSIGLPGTAAGKEMVADFASGVAPLLDKYCTACHGADEPESDLDLSSFAGLSRGGEGGPVIVAGASADSRLIRVLRGQAEPAMPPEDSEAPTEEEIATLAAWIDGGARPPDGPSVRPAELLVPHIEPPPDIAHAVTALAHHPDGRRLAVGRFARVELLSLVDGQVQHVFEPHPGKVHDIQFDATGSRMIVASGVNGMYGEARVWNLEDGQLIASFRGHADTLYASRISPDGGIAATASYDGRIILWDIAKAEAIRELTGHNGAVYDIAFSPDGKVLASASGDSTVKVWQVATGIRLDTLSQPTGEQYTVVFSRDGSRIVAAGADNRIRAWKLVSVDSPAINPLQVARFAHERAVVRLVFSADGGMLASAAEDGFVKLWDAATYTELHVYPRQPDVPSALSLDPSGKHLAVGRMDGSLDNYPVQRTLDARSTASVSKTRTFDVIPGQPAEPQPCEDAEPNDTPQDAQPIAVPAVLTGTISKGGSSAEPDTDYFRFEARAGQAWTLEIRAARDQSPLDSFVEVLDSEGQPIVRTLLQAVRDSYLTFRGKDSRASSDFRLHNWEEMEINQFLYLQGEVVKLFQYPRGPDSGFWVYPGEGNRWTYFDTTGATHALHEPCYIVKAYAPDAEIVPNGLPVYDVHYENDDASHRRWGTDSFLMFVAPGDGTYLARVSDVRGFGGEEYVYQLAIRTPKPDFQVRLENQSLAVSPGGGKTFGVVVDREDGFQGEIRVDIEGLPDGLSSTAPVVIQRGHQSAQCALYASRDTEANTQPPIESVVITATAVIGGQEVTRTVQPFSEIKIGEPPKIRVTLESHTPQLVITPGETIDATLRVERNGFDERIKFEAHNLPHGVYVDNIGLNGILITEGRTERTIQLTAAGWVPETERVFCIETEAAGGQVSPPVTLVVRRPPQLSRSH